MNRLTIIAGLTRHNRPNDNNERGYLSKFHVSLSAGHHPTEISNYTTLTVIAVTDITESLRKVPFCKLRLLFALF